MANQRAQFEWVNSTMTNPKISQDLAIRVKIRKQAMKKAANTRRAEGNYGKINLRQYPVFEGNVADEVRGEPTRLRRQPLEDDKQISSLPQISNANPGSVAREVPNEGPMQASLSLINLSATSYQAVRMKFGFDILELSSLTTIHVGRGSLPIINADKDGLVRQFSSRFQPIQWSFFTFVPSLYGEYACLSRATDCLMSRVCQILMPESADHWQVIKISNYIKALGSLQKAIDNPSRRLSPEVLCATEILALYELLDAQGERAWMRHSAGVSRLIQLRGPRNFKTDFEKSLFLAHLGPLMTEAMLNGERCFLEEDPWTGVFHSLIRESPQHTERSEVVIQLLILKCCIPGNLKDVTDHICDRTDDNTPNLEDLANRIRKLRADLLSWCRYHEKFLGVSKERPSLFEKKSRLYATYLACQILVSRLLACISFQREHLEKDIQILVDHLLNIEAEVTSVSKNANMLYLAQVIGVGHATKVTKQEWVEMSEWESKRGLIDRWKFELWCKLFGRRV